MSDAVSLEINFGTFLLLLLLLGLFKPGVTLFSHSFPQPSKKGKGDDTVNSDLFLQCILNK